MQSLREQQLTYSVCVDYSVSSIDALTLVIYEILQKDQILSVVHIFDKDNNYNSQELQMQCEAIAMSRVRNNTDSSNQLLNSLKAQKQRECCRSDLLSLQVPTRQYNRSRLYGNLARTDKNTIKLTSICDYILRTSAIPILFIKLKEKREENPLGDGSEKSFKAFQLGIKLYNKFYDKLLIVYSSPAQKSKFLQRQSDQIVEFYNKELNSRKLENAAFIHVEAQDLQTIQDTLVLFVHRYHTDIEFVIAGSNGRRAEIEDQQKVVSVIGSTALELLKKCKSNVLIYK